MKRPSPRALVVGLAVFGVVLAAAAAALLAYDEFVRRAAAQPLDVRARRFGAGLGWLVLLVPAVWGAHAVTVLALLRAGLAISDRRLVRLEAATALAVLAVAWASARLTGGAHLWLWLVAAPAAVTGLALGLGARGERRASAEQPAG